MVIKLESSAFEIIKKKKYSSFQIYTLTTESVLIY